MVARNMNLSFDSWVTAVASAGRNRRDAVTAGHQPKTVTTCTTMRKTE
jgi:hypothetical protein